MNWFFFFVTWLTDEEEETFFDVIRFEQVNWAENWNKSRAVFILILFGK